MVTVFEALDNEFAASTGSNVNSSPGRSIFDYPPNSTMDLVVTSKPSDANPGLFELGETYELSWAGSGGGGTITDATVIRSDPAPGVGDGGVIVFEGIDENGDLVQIVWTPDFDLESWYFDNFDQGQPPEFYTTDQDATYSHSVMCFEAKTPILTDRGRCQAGRIRVGDRVWTLDGGYREVLWVGHQTVPGIGRYAPVRFEVGTLRNKRTILLSQQHRVLIQSAQAELLFADHEVLVPAKAMDGMPGITLAPCSAVHYVHLLLGEHHLLNVAGGLCESLFLGDMTDLITTEQMSPDTKQMASQLRHIAARPILTYREARCLLRRTKPVVTAGASL
ncbi:MAG: Hint domain-containing protein [Roseovarius sp.]